jgi:hypothetical protein
MATEMFSISSTSEQTASRDFRRQLLEGYSLTTAKILYPRSSVAAANLCLAGV